MNKIIFKTALVTLGALVAAAVAVFSLWILISPQTMASYCEKTGNYSFAVTCADLRYKYTKDVKDLARCAQDGIASGKDALIVKYCEMLIGHEGFDDLCKSVDESIPSTEYGKYATDYKAYVCGNLAAAQYRGGNLDKALKTAESGKSFVKLVIEIIENGTAEEADKALASLGDTDENLKKLLEEFKNQGK